MVIAVLSLQGAFVEHKKILDKIGIDSFEIRNKEDLNKKFDGIILPGGESTVIGKLLRELEIFDVLKEKIKNGLPTFGTCAGMILLAKNLINDDRKHFAIMDIEVRRNAYGRQLGSFFTENEFKGIGTVPMVFIRAPYVEKVKNNVEVLSVVDENIVAVRQNNILATSYHPELTNDTKVHQYFVNMVKEYSKC